jgi:TnsA endonuclease N terminal
VRRLRRIPLSRRSHITGFQALGVSGSTQHESALERDFVMLATFRDATAQIISQPITLAFQDDSGPRRYTPDYLVRWTDGRSELVEVKYRADLRENWSRLRPAFEIARSWAREHQARFRIATERGIRCPMLANARRLLPLRTVPLDVDIAEEVRAVVRSLSEPTFADLVAMLPNDRGPVLGTLWRMIARSDLRADLSAPIGFHTRLALP